MIYSYYLNRSHNNILQEYNSTLLNTVNRTERRNPRQERNMKGINAFVN